MSKKTTYTFLVNSTDDIDYDRICREAPEGVDAILVERTKGEGDFRLLARVPLALELCATGLPHYTTDPKGIWRVYPLSTHRAAILKERLAKARAAIEARKNRKQVKVEYL